MAAVHLLARAARGLVFVFWRAVLKRAPTSAASTRQHTPALGTRSLDVFHVASAFELDRRRFVTFDERQKQLAVATGLKSGGVFV